MSEVPFSSPSDWNSVSLEALSDFITKGTTPTTLGFQWVESGVPFLRSECVSETGFSLSGAQFITAEAHRALARSAVRQGDVLITITGNVGRVCCYPSHLPEGNINQHIARVRINPDGRADADFVRQCLSSAAYRKYFGSITTGQAYPQLSLAQVRDTVVALPPLGEQRKIAAILSAVDDAIEATQAVINQLQVVKKAMVAELLTRGLPGRHTRFKQTEIGEVPEGWEVTTLGTVLSDIVGGGTPARDVASYWNGSIPWASVKDMKRRILATTQETITNEGLESSAANLIPAGTLVLCCRMNVGAVCRASVDVAINQDLKALLHTTAVDTGFLHWWLDSQQEGLAEKATGSTVKGIRLEAIRALPFAVPPVPEQVAVAQALDAVTARADADAASLAALAGLKSALMVVLLRGEVRVNPAEAAP